MFYSTVASNSSETFIFLVGRQTFFFFSWNVRLFLASNRVSTSFVRLSFFVNSNSQFICQTSINSSRTSDFSKVSLESEATVVDFHVFQEFSSKIMKTCMFGTKKCFRENVILELGVRKKLFCTPLDDSDGSWEVV